MDKARSRNYNENTAGTRLALAIVKHLIESLGGKVSAMNNRARGVTMTVELPA